jgi:hypothetical protein
MPRIVNTADMKPHDIYDADETSWRYNFLDCALTAEIFQALGEHDTDESLHIYDTISRPLQAPILEMNMTGVLVDRRVLAEETSRLMIQAEQLETQLHKIVVDGYGYSSDFNPRSPKQLQEFLYTYLRCPVKKKRNPKGGFSPTTDRGALESLAESVFVAKPFLNHMLALRDIHKALGFLRTKIDDDSRMRTNFNIAGTKTGRLASSYGDMGTGTNLQNVSRALRRVFVAPNGKKLGNLDLEQADSRNVGATCWNRFVDAQGEAFAGSYLDACESGDLHTTVTKMARPELDWPDDPALWRDFADTPRDEFRGKSYRDASKGWGHGCLTADHEVLTRDGWVPISSMPNEIFTWSLNGGDFAPVSHWTNYIAPETINILGTAYSLRATPDHRLPRNHNNRLFEIRAEHLPLRSGRIYLDGDYKGGTETVPARLIAAIMSDGELHRNKTRFHFHKERKKARIRQLAQEYGYACTDHPDGRISVAYSHPKTLGAYALNWTRECILDFVREYAFWDGHRGKTAQSCFSTNRAQMEWLQTLGRLVGYGGNIQAPRTSGFGSTIHTLQQNTRKFAYIPRLTVTRIAEPTPVYCPTVPTGWFLVRREGKISVTGNSNYLLTAQSAVKKIPGVKLQQAVDFKDAYFEAFPCIPEWHRAVAHDLREYASIKTIWGRRRYFFGRLDDSRTHREAVAYEGQSPTADEINLGLIKMWRESWHTAVRRRFPGFRLLVQVHDSILFEYDEECEDECIPWAMEALRVELILARGRPFTVPTEAKVGWNWADFNDNPKRGPINLDGLKKWKGQDDRTRTEPHTDKPSALW